MTAVQRAQLNYLRMAPRKVRSVAETIKGLSVSEAEASLMLSPRRAKEPILKLLRSAIANAKQNKSIAKEKLVVSEVRVDEGPMLKRFLPRAMGRATPIHKKTSHLTIVLAEVLIAKPSRFKIAIGKKVKPQKTEKAKADKEKEKPKEKWSDQKAKEPGFIKRMFRRKSI